jgi:hypothetical protein
MRHWFFVLTGFLVSVATVSGAAATTPAFEQGRADRQAVETWFAGLSGDFRAGADYWAAHRSNRPRSSCSAAGRTADFVSGCRAAKQQFDPTDARRKAEPDYFASWNSSPAPTRTPSPSPSPSPAPSGECPHPTANCAARAARKAANASALAKARTMLCIASSPRSSRSRSSEWSPSSQPRKLRGAFL